MFLKYVRMFMIGFTSGLPFLMTLTILDVWLKDSGFSNSLIGFITIVSMPYIFKFLWAPFIDRIQIPFFAERIGSKKAWVLVSQILISISFFGMSKCDPNTSLKLLMVFTSLAAFAISCQNIALYSFQIDHLEKQQFGPIASFVIFGYRIGMLTANCGSLLLANSFDWHTTYFVMSIFILICSLVLLFIKEPTTNNGEEQNRMQRIAKKVLRNNCHNNKFIQTLKSIFIECLILPFHLFMKHRHWIHYIFIVATFKAGDVMAHKMSKPLYIELGFSKPEIASVVGVFGVIATIFGGFLGGYMIKKLRVKRSMLLCAIIHAFANLAYLALYISGHQLTVFYAAVAIENVSGGMMMTAFLSFLYKTCAYAYPATQYALLWGIHGLSATFFRGISGVLVDNFGWVNFYMASFLISVPSIIAVYLLISRRNGVVLSNGLPEATNGGNGSSKDIGSCRSIRKRRDNNP